MVEVERLEESTEGRISAFLALGEVAAGNLADEDDHPDKHGGHADEAREDALDEVDDQQVRGVPCPEHRVGQLAVAENDPVAQEDEELGDDEANHDLKDGGSSG